MYQLTLTCLSLDHHSAYRDRLDLIGQGRSTLHLYMVPIPSLRQLWQRSSTGRISNPLLSHHKIGQTTTWNPLPLPIRYSTTPHSELTLPPKGPTPYPSSNGHSKPSPSSNRHSQPSPSSNGHSQPSSSSNGHSQPSPSQWRRNHGGAPVKTSAALV